MIQTLGTVGALGAVAGCTAVSQDDDEDEGRPAEETDVDSIAADPTDLPDPIDRDEPEHHELEIQTEELVAEIEDGVTHRFMTFDGQIPGPFVRARVGDTVHLTFDVPDDLNADVHNIDFHAVYGPGGGAADTTIAPGEGPVEIEFRLEYPGAFYYHCAPGQHDYHISTGMFGTILVEPEDGLPEVDRELYLGQHELYTDMEVGEEGHHNFDFDAAADENPTYVLFNGEVGTFTEGGDQGRIHAETDETVRVYWCNAGPNLMSGPHPIGNVWARWYDYGDIESEPVRNVEGAALPAGTTGVGEMELPVPGPVKLVDHALSRTVRKGLLAEVEVEGEEDTDIYNPDP
ncbi:nitrite reductase, copper-containing [Natronorubrum sp. JWXQ-INN-674]|uniref:Copper-containing nitrite reductase n=1 Tax=Natronorubrum halalkaliphilum TaxID=2691917 RepID=A0A6B0VTM0_9EURY|nr:copper-containing nitrite reductase [Natronorubrum halalkaliphilum]MXV64236.1 nitrite reductase, copper-containing [Natronorubrum halalkaliphilum]